MFWKKSPRVEVFLRSAYLSHVSQHKKRPSYFSYENCFQNLIQTMDPRFHLTILLDTQYGSEHFVTQSAYPVIEIQEGTEAGSFLRLLDYVNEQKFSDNTILYFVEDDYLHHPQWSSVLLEAFTLNVDYVTLYDHRDKYVNYENLKSKIYHTKSCHWREVPSTTNTYAMKMKTLKKDFSIHQEFSKSVTISKDHEKFCKLSKQGAILVSSIPGYSTHMEESLESPCRNWKEISLLI